MNEEKTMRLILEAAGSFYNKKQAYVDLTAGKVPLKDNGVENEVALGQFSENVEKTLELLKGFLPEVMNVIEVTYMVHTNAKALEYFCSASESVSDILQAYVDVCKDRDAADVSAEYRIKFGNNSEDLGSFRITGRLFVVEDGTFHCLSEIAIMLTL